MPAKSKAQQRFMGIKSYGGKIGMDKDAVLFSFLLLSGLVLLIVGVARLLGI